MGGTLHHTNISCSDMLASLHATQQPVAFTKITYRKQPVVLQCRIAGRQVRALPTFRRPHVVCTIVQEAAGYRCGSTASCNLVRTRLFNKSFWQKEAPCSAKAGTAKIMPVGIISGRHVVYLSIWSPAHQVA